MAKVRAAALEAMAMGRTPVRYHWASVMVYLDRYDVIELEFDI